MVCELETQQIRTWDAGTAPFDTLGTGPAPPLRARPAQTHYVGTHVCIWGLFLSAARSKCVAGYTCTIGSRRFGNGWGGGGGPNIWPLLCAFEPRRVIQRHLVVAILYIDLRCPNQMCVALAPAATPSSQSTTGTPVHVAPGPAKKPNARVRGVRVARASGARNRTRHGTASAVHSAWHASHASNATGRSARCLTNIRRYLRADSAQRDSATPRLPHVASVHG